MFVSYADFLFATVTEGGLKHKSAATFIANFFYGHKCLRESEVVDYIVKKVCGINVPSRDGTCQTLCRDGTGRENAKLFLQCSGKVLFK
jgi:hypothetical protein